jgi:predicted phosphodiesterase
MHSNLDRDAIVAEIQRLAREGYTEAEIVRVLDLSRGKVRYILERARRLQEEQSALNPLAPTTPTIPTVVQPVENPNVNYDGKKLFKLLRSHPQTIEQIMGFLGTGNKAEAYLAIDDMENRGYAVQKDHTGYYIPYRVIKGQPRSENELLIADGHEEFQVGVVSDTHLSSVHQQLTHLNSMYDIFAARGIKNVFCPGDLTEGNGRIYRGQVYEMFNHGSDAQRDYLVSHFPSRPGIRTYVIAGNHDYSFQESDGCDVVKGFANQREDIEYLGIYQADIIYNGVRFRLQHGASSGKGTDVLERYIKAYGADVPDVLLVGHYHTAVFTNYNGCVALTGGGWHGWILHIKVSKTTRKILSVIPELIRFPNMLEHDY